MFKKGQTKSAFTIELVSDIEKEDMLIVRSSFEDLREVSRIFKYNKKEILDLHHLVKTIKILSKLICFLHHEEYNPEHDYTKVDFLVEPLKGRQAIMKDIGIIDILMDIAHFPFEHEFYTIEDIDKPLYISKVISLCYISIKFVIKELRPNKLYASQWLDMIAEYSLKDTKNILHAKETLTELIDNNEKILSVQIKDPIITRLVGDFFNSKPDDKVVGIIRAMCICNGEPVKKNQTKIIKLLLADKMNLRKVMAELWKREDTGQVFISNPWDLNSNKKIDLKELKTESQKIDDGRYYHFYINLIGLLTDICFGRNYSAINILVSYFPLELLIDIICENSFDPEIRTAMTRLIEVLYIDVFPYQGLKIPHLIRIYKSEDIRTEDLELSCSHKSSEENNRLEGLTTFMLKIIQCPLDMGEVAEAAELYTAIIELCNKMIKLGYFKKYSDIKSIYDRTMKMVSANWSREQYGKLSKSKTIIKFKESTDRSKGYSLQMYSDKVEFSMKVSKLKMALCKIVMELLYVETDFQITRTAIVYEQMLTHESNEGLGAVATFEHQSLLDPERKIADGKYSEDDSLKRLFKFIEDKILMSSNLIEKQPHLTNFLIENTLGEDKELKDFSLKLLQELYTGGQRLFKYMQLLIVIDSDQDNEFYTHALEFQRKLFKIYENMPNWYNNSNRLSIEYMNTSELLKSIKEDFKDASKLSAAHGNLENNQMSNHLFEMSRDYLFVNLYLQKLQEYLPQFYQNLLDKTGIVDHILKMVTYIITQLSLTNREPEDEVLAENKALLNELILLLCRAVHDNSYIKSKFLPYIDSWLKTIAIYNSKSKLNDIEKPKNYMQRSVSIRQGSPSKVKVGSSFRFTIEHSTDESVEGDIPFLSNMIQLIIQVLRNSRDILKDNSLISIIIHGLLDILCKSHRRTANFYLMAQVMHALEELVCDKYMPIRANQSLVIKLLAVRNKEGVLYYYQNTTVFPTMENDLRLKIKMEEMDSIPIKVMHSKLCMDLAFVSLVGMCTFENNEYAERIAQSFIPPRYYFFLKLGMSNTSVK